MEQIDFLDEQLQLPLKEQVIQNAKKLLEDLYKEYGVPLSKQSIQAEQTREQGRSRGF